MTVCYLPYSEYKPSPVHWHGNLPSHWGCRPLKHLCGFQGGGTPSKDVEDYWHGDIPWVSPKDMKQKFINSSGDFITAKAIDGSSTKLVKEGALLMVVRSGILQRTIPVAINTEAVTLNQDMKAMIFGKQMAACYAFYYIEGNQSNLLLDWSKQGATVESIEHEYLSNSMIPVPSIDEQQNIVNFLDCETAKIDSLIEKQQQLIKLLKEKRQAVISHAVTKGLNLDAPMRNSGVEWLGEVPEHWMKIKVKRLFKFAKRQGHVDLTVLSVYRDYGVIVKSSRDDNFNKTPDDLSTYQLVKEGDLVINKMKAWQGSMGISEFEGITSPDYAVYSPLHRNEDLYLHFWFRAGHMPDVYMNISTGIRPNQWRLDLEEFENLDVFMPPQEERAAIVERIKEVEGKYLKLISLAETQITLLSERRAALISAAVTGKIDVRNWQATPFGEPIGANDEMCNPDKTIRAGMASDCAEATASFPGQLS